MEDWAVLPQGFLIFFLFDFVFPINLKNKPSLSLPDGVSVVCVSFDIGHVFFGIKTCSWCKTFAQNIGDEGSCGLSFISFEEHEEHWFLAKLCKAEQGVK